MNNFLNFADADILTLNIAFEFTHGNFNLANATPNLKSIIYCRLRCFKTSEYEYKNYGNKFYNSENNVIFRLALKKKLLCYSEGTLLIFHYLKLKIKAPIYNFIILLSQLHGFHNVYV